MTPSHFQFADCELIIVAIKINLFPSLNLALSQRTAKSWAMKL
jgi:hypothetical protein